MHMSQVYVIGYVNLFNSSPYRSQPFEFLNVISSLSPKEAYLNIASQRAYGIGDICGWAPGIC